jgi:hypothetical protein
MHTDSVLPVQSNTTQEHGVIQTKLPPFGYDYDVDSTVLLSIGLDALLVWHLDNFSSIYAEKRGHRSAEEEKMNSGELNS